MSACRWESIRREEAERVRASGHAALVARAAGIMPRLSAADAAEMRTAMLAGPGAGLRELVVKHWSAA